MCNCTSVACACGAHRDNEEGVLQQQFCDYSTSANPEGVTIGQFSGELATAGVSSV